MKALDRRSALKITALSAASVPVLLSSSDASAQRYGADEGKEVAPGVRIIQLTERPSEIAAYKTISMRDIVFQPNAKIEAPAMDNDMICHVLEGALQIDQGGNQFEASTGQVWSCAKGQPETSVNETDTVAIMRVTDLLES